MQKPGSSNKQASTEEPRKEPSAGGITAVEKTTKTGLLPDTGQKECEVGKLHLVFGSLGKECFVHFNKYMGLRERYLITSTNLFF